MSHFLVNVTSFTDMAVSKIASQPTLGYSSPSVSRASLADLVDASDCLRFGVTADVGLTLEPVTIQPNLKPMSRVRSATLCVDTVQHMSANPTPLLQPQMMVMGRELSFENLGARALSPPLRPVPSVNGLAMASARTSGTSLASAMKRGSQTWEAGSAANARDASIEVREGGGGPPTGHEGWRVPHPTALPPTSSDEQEDTIGLSLDIAPSPSFALQRQRSMSSAVVPAAQTATPVIMYSPLMAAPVWVPSSHNGTHARAPIHSLPLSRDKGSAAALPATVQANPFYKVAQPGSSQGMSSLAKQLDLPINGVRYEECVICRCPGQCDDDRCCHMPRHFECELANQRANVLKWTWNEETGVVELPCSACRQVWGELQPSDPLVESAISAFIKDCQETLAKRRETIRQELMSSPEERKRTRRRRLGAALGVTPVTFGVTAAGLAFGLKGALALAALLPVSAAVGIVCSLLVIKGIERMRYNILLSVAAEMAEAQTDVPSWMHKVLLLAKAQKTETA